jgi:hypothetical protein
MVEFFKMDLLFQENSKIELLTLGICAHLTANKC